MNNHIITISRQYGSGGRYVGKMLSEKLGIPFYDNEIITMSAKKSGYSEALFEKAEQFTNGSLLYSLTMFGQPAGIGGLPLSEKVYIIQSDVIKHLADQGPCIIIGRCANYVLKEHTDTINFFLYSDIEHRIKRAVNYYGLEEKNARDLILKKDKKRAAYYNYYTGERWGELSNYHLSLDTDSIGIENCVDLLESYIRHFHESN